jgi:two-component system CheB/CheR fusion protein
MRSLALDAEIDARAGIASLDLDSGESELDCAALEELDAEDIETAESRVMALGTMRELERRYRDGLTLTEVHRALIGEFSFERVTAIVCRAARDLLGADGAAFVLREGSSVRYVAEDAIAPLWNGQRFPLECCISGWSMARAQAVVLEDVYADQRIPQVAYRSTFVQSLAMMPIGPRLPVASIGVYWAHRHRASAYELELLESLASAADRALGGVRAFERARQARAEAEQANQLKDEFLATLSHELRNPLNSIVGFAELLLRSPEAGTEGPISQAARAIHDNARAQARLINDLLDLSRLQTGKLALERRPIQLERLVESAIASLREGAADKGLELSLVVPDAPVGINADPVRIQEVVWNLVSNAIKFTPRGGRLRVSVGEELGMAHLVVEDTGQGIAADLLPHVFEMFRQGDGRITRAHRGLGIGLALVRQLVELHDGRVEARSDGAGKGARFSVRLPLERAAAGPDEAARSAVRCALTGVRVMIVDDSADSLDMLRSLLESEGAVVHEALSAEAALTLAESAELDVIISDISMPHMDGYELMRRLRARPRHAGVPAFALTGFGRDVDIARALSAGFTEQLTKPLDFPLLLDKLRGALGR